MIMTVEDQVELKEVEEERAKIRTKIAEAMETKARLESQVLLMKIQLIEQLQKTEKKKREALETLGRVRKEC